MTKPQILVLGAADPVAALAAWVTGVVESLGSVGVGAMIALENVFPPIPSELILPLAGFLAGQGRLSLPAAVCAATVGAVAGALVLYALGAWLGRERLRHLIGRYGRFLGVQPEDLDRTQGWFDRHGGKVVFFGRLVPIVRSLVSIPAGFARMPLPTFVAYTAVGSLLWNSLLIGVGWAVGDQWQRVGQYTKPLEYAVLAVLVIAVGRFVWRRRHVIVGRTHTDHAEGAE